MKLGALVISVLLITGCSMKQEADLILRNAKIYTVDEDFSIADAVAIKDGKIMAIGTTREVLDDYSSKETIDLKSKPVYPGFIDAHCHFVGYGLSLRKIDLKGTNSFLEVIEKVKAHAEDTDGWITGRGWDQNDWEVKEFPTAGVFDSLFPDRPVLIKRVDGHAALANKAALKAAGVNAETTIDGGTLAKENGELTGLLVDNAIDLVEDIIPSPTEEQYRAAILAAQKNCHAVGLTTVDDAGLDLEVVDLIDKMHQEGTLTMKIYVMLNPTKENFGHYGEVGATIKERLTVRSFKFYVDGALGSRGAALKAPYSDDPTNSGLILNELDYLSRQAGVINTMGFQMNTHCIGDRGNKLVLDMYAKELEGANDKRWRIEHAQIVDPADFSLFGEYNIIPSVQPTHCTSDMPWADERLGEERMQGAYAYKDLLAQNGMIAGGSDFPIEGINPLLGFYAAVERKDGHGHPTAGFQMENAISRDEALRSMTIWAAISNFEEDNKGSLEVGKDADLVILDTDIMTEDLSNIGAIKVLGTYINGEQVY